MQRELEPLSDSLGDLDPALLSGDADLFETTPAEIKHEDEQPEDLLSAEDYISLVGLDRNSLDASLFMAMPPHEQYNLLRQLDGYV